MRLIDADELILALGKEGVIDTHPYWAVRCAPTVDAAPVRHGHWIEEPIEDEWGKLPSIWHCSECDNLELNNSPYCPNCGAKMEEIEK